MKLIACYHFCATCFFGLRLEYINYTHLARFCAYLGVTPPTRRVWLQYLTSPGTPNGFCYIPHAPE